MAKGGFAPFESPDGKYVYYAKGRSVAGLWRVPVAGGQEEMVMDALPAEHWGLWALAPGGDIFFVDREGTSKYVLKRFNGGKISPVAALEKPAKVADAGLAISPDGRTALVAQVDGSGADIQLVENPPLD
jgi:hypothetical protein